MIYYKSKQLSYATGIPIAKWKRWVREFLPPDPLGGLQSGYARQFSLRDAFRVYLGGFLVQELKLSIADARTALKDLNEWLRKNGYFELTAANGKMPENHKAGPHLIYILRSQSGRMGYVIHSAPKTSSLGDPGAPPILINIQEDPIATGEVIAARMLGITFMYHTFLDCVTASH